ncbi:MAG: Carbamoyl-phosphate synthase arginine-specific small chain [Chlamydiae bacterium]|nr:Carbamoyl-phosphate synthase arginine-specific small chain [Chlamydiota bacterium]
MLKLKDGSEFKGSSPQNSQGTYFGEVVFTTGMTGYVESLTDPSYIGQILCFTYPLIGNYGVPDKKYWESKKIHVAGVVIGEASHEESHYESQSPFLKWLESQNVPVIMGVDTRRLTKTLREEGSLLGILTTEKGKHSTFHNPNDDNLVSKVTISEKATYGSGSKRVIALDCGMKESQMRYLLDFPIEVIRVPYDYNFLEDAYDGLFISNGPGDPQIYSKTIEHVKQALKNKKPIFGICLGMQLLALAAGAKSYKLPYGHRGQNQPCMDLKTKKCYITSQNHGYAIKKDLPNHWEASFINLNDHSVEGVRHKTHPFFSVQFHPEAHGGPLDTHFLFEEFYQSL